MPDLTPRAVLDRMEPPFSRLESAVTDFARWLAAERSALEADDMDALLAAGQRKEAGAQQVAAAAGALLETAAACGFAATTDGLRDCIRHAARADQGIAGRREVLASLTARCERDNAVHGRVLATRRAAAEQALSILLGRGHDAGAGAYDASGQRSPRDLRVERDVV